MNLSAYAPEQGNALRASLNEHVCAPANDKTVVGYAGGGQVSGGAN